MDVREKLDLLGAAARYDDCRTAALDAIAEGRGFFAPETITAADPRVLPCISHLHTPDGQRKPTLKILQTSACQNNCNYCAFRAGRDIRRVHLTPDELARSFDLMYRAGLVESLFLSSGVIGTHRTMDEMLATTELVRQRYGFRGYIHLKLLPGAEDAHIERAVELADRVSMNLEAPTTATLAALAPLKRMDALVGPLRKAAEIIARGDPLAPHLAAGRGRPRGWAQGPPVRWGRPVSACPPSSSSGRRARATASCCPPRRCSTGSSGWRGPTTARLPRWAARRWRASRPPIRSASFACIRPIGCCAATTFRRMSCRSILLVSSAPTWIPRPPGRRNTPNVSRWKLTPRLWTS